MAKNYFDKDGNYINVENLSLAEIYLRAAEEGYKKGYVDASIEAVRTKAEEDSISHMTDNLYNKLIGGGNENSKS